MPNPDDPTLDDPRFQSLLVSCLERLEQGGELDAEALKAEYPDFADALEGFLADREQLVEMASAIRDGSGSFTSDPDAPTVTPHGATRGPGPGSRIRYFGDYELLEEIARGGMGVVYKARQEKLRRVVALKMILAGQLAGEQDVERFEREARAAAKLSHPNIVTVHEVGEHEGQHYFSMDFVEGRSLSEALREGPIPAREAATLVGTVAGAIQSAHDQGTLHRDLKPGNVLLDGEGRPHVTDFGLAKITEDDEAGSELTTSGQILGTPSYMSPEQAEGKHRIVGVASDVYSLGAILYACLTGRPPFAAESPFDTLLQVINGEPVPPRLLNPKVPRDLETICLKCLEKRPHERYGTAQLLSEDLGRFLNGEPIQARPVGRLEHAWRWCRRNPAAAGLVFVGLLAVLAASGLLVALAYQSELTSARDAAVALAEEKSFLAKEKSDLAAEKVQLAEVAERARARAFEAEQDVRDARDEIDRILFTERIRAAQQALEGPDVDLVRAEQLLDECPVQLRGWDWRYLAAQLGRRLVRIDTGDVRYERVQFDGDGNAVLGFGRKFGADWRTSGTRLTRWDATTGVALWTHEYQWAWRTGRADPTGTWLAYVDEEEMVLVVRATATGERRVLVGAEAGRWATLAWSRDGSRLAAGDLYNGLIRVWDVADGTLSHSHTWSGGRTMSLAFGVDNDVLFGCGNRKFFAYDIEEARELFAVKYEQLSGHVATSPDGRWVTISNSQADGIELRDATNGQVIRRIPALGVFATTFHPEGNRILGRQRSRVQRVWDVEDGREVKSLAAHANLPTLGGFSADGTRLLSGSLDEVVVWRTTSPVEAGHLAGETSVWNLAVDHAGKRLALVGERGASRVVDFETGEQLASFSNPSALGHIEFSPDGRLLLTRLNGVQLWEAGTGREVRLFPGRSIGCATFHPDGSRVVTGERDHNLRVWDVESGEVVRTLEGHADGVTAVAYSPDGSIIASGAKAPKIWNAASGTLLATLPSEGRWLLSIHFSPDGTRLAVGWADGKVEIWNVDELELETSFRTPSSSLRHLRFDPTGARIATSGGRGAEVGVWDVRTGRRTLELNVWAGLPIGFGPSSSPALTTPAVFSPDGRHLIAGGKRLHVWSTEAELSEP